MSILSLILITVFVFGDCNISTGRKNEMCPVTPDHIYQVNAYHSCMKKGTGSSRSRKNQANSSNRHDYCVSEAQKERGAESSLAFMLAPAVLLKMSPEQKQRELQKFFQQNRQGMIDDVARKMFQEDFSHLDRKAQPPVWDEDLSEDKRGKLSQRAAKKRSSLSFLQNTHRQLESRARGNNQKAKELLQKFEAKYQTYIRAANRKGGNWVQIKEPKVFRYRSGLVDIANDAWQDIPEDFTYERADGKRVKLKGPYNQTAARQIGKVENALTRGLDWRDVTLATDKDRIRLQGIVNERGAKFRTDAEARLGRRMGKIGKTSGNRVKRGPGGGLRAVRVAGGWVTMAALSAVGLYMSQVEDCKKAFPFYPTRYEKPNVHGLGPRSKCFPVFPNDGKGVSEVEGFASLEYAAMYEILNKDQSAASPCAYYQQAYRKLFCSESFAGEGADDSTL